MSIADDARMPGPMDAAADATPAIEASADSDSGVIVFDIDSFSWSPVGLGVVEKDTKNPLGNATVIAYAGYGVALAGAEGWATALWKAKLRDAGFRYVVAVQGPADPQCSQKEIGNSKIAIDPSTSTVLVVGHSSASFVANEFFEQRMNDATIMKKIVYFDLDGGGGFAFEKLHAAYFVAAHDGATLSPNYAEMKSLGTFIDIDASGSGCDPGAKWCVHMTLVISKPHDPTNSDPVKDYTDFVMRPVVTSYLDGRL